MERARLKDLVAWKDSPYHKPLLLLGARQVGKTWLLREFGKACFQHVAYLRFDTDPRARHIFEQDFDIPRILESLQMATGVPIKAGETLVVLDEIQDCPAALTALKYLCEDARELHVAAAGSLLGLEIHYGTGFPVGKVNMMNLYPLSFTEFMHATGNGRFAEALDKRDWQMLNIFHSRYADMLRLYFYIGGMPAAVQRYLDTGEFRQVREVQRELLRAYRLDFSKHADAGVAALIEQIWDSIPEQIARENKKFVYSDAAPGLRARNAAAPMLWLLRSGLIHHNNRVKKPEMPLTAYRDGAFKAFLNDVGLLAALCNLDTRILLEHDRVFGEYKGALTEQYVQQQLLAEGHDDKTYYWARERNEIDFLLTTDRGIVPLEAKAGVNLNSKSLHVFCKRFGFKLAVRTSMHTYQRNTVTPTGGEPYEIIELPLYALSQLHAECGFPKPSYAW